MRPPDFWFRSDLLSRLAVSLLTPLGWLYASSTAFRATHTSKYLSSAKILCVGNLTVGGTGKTPIALEISRLLIARGAHPVFLSRGYGGSNRGAKFVGVDDLAQDVGDEPLLLASVAPVIVSRDRAAGAKLAEQKGFDTIIMDDGHQNFTLAKDLTLIVVDAEWGFGNERVLPAGPLREPVSKGLQRADAIIINGDGTPPALTGTSLPMIRVHVEPLDASSWTGKRVWAFAGIGRPQNFFTSLADVGADIVQTQSFDDHHFYSRAEMARLRANAHTKNATLVTTQKDFVRLPPSERHGILTLNVRATFAELEQLERLLDRIVPRGLPPQPR